MIRDLTRLALALWGSSAALYAFLFAGPIMAAPAGPPSLPAPALLTAAAPTATPNPASTAQVSAPTASTTILLSAPTLLQPAPPTATTAPVAPTMAAPAPPDPAAGADAPSASSRSGPEYAWLRTSRETSLWSGPDEAASEFVKIPSGTVVVALESASARTLAYVGGGEGRRDGEVWLDTADLQPIAWPRWVRNRRATALRAEPNTEASVLTPVPAGTHLETIGEPTGRWARVFYLGDGRSPEPVEGWVDADAFSFPTTPQATLTASTVTRATMAENRPEVWLPVPYRTQLDGSRYAQANCGPASVAMVLEALGKWEPLDRLRAMALEQQGTPDCDSCGLFIQHLATVTQDGGARMLGLRGEGDALRRWTLEEIRAQLRDGHVVVPQVMYRHLPGRATSGYWGDHYVVVTGILGNAFIYNDPLNHDGSGYGRVISAEALEKAMAESDFPFAAFAVGR